MLQQALIDALNSPGVVVHVIPGPPGGAKVVTTLLSVASIAASTMSPASQAIDLHAGAATLAITITAVYDAAATTGIKVHVVTSPDNVQYDNAPTVGSSFNGDWDSWIPNFLAGNKIQQTKNYDTAPAFIKVYIDNLDAVKPVTMVSVIATVG